MKTTLMLVGFCLTCSLATAQEVEQIRLLASGYQPQLLEEAGITISAANEVLAGSTVEYKAGQAVLLQPGFEAKAGAVFTAHTGTISTNNDGKQLSVTVYPNPFDQTTTLSYVLTRAGRTSLHIRDNEGRLLAKLVDNQYQEAGSYQVEWKGGHLPAGTYVYTLEAGVQQLSKRIIRK